MIIMKKHIAAVILIIIAVVIIFFGIEKYESRQTFADSDLKIVLDAGHGAYVQYFRSNRFYCVIRII
ncbi:MAG: hypothetical protein ACI4A5_06095 [Hominilimicola sp.]